MRTVNVPTSPRARHGRWHWAMALSPPCGGETEAPRVSHLPASVSQLAGDRARMVPTLPSPLPLPPGTGPSQAQTFPGVTQEAFKLNQQGLCQAWGHALGTPATPGREDHAGSLGPSSPAPGSFANTRSSEPKTNMMAERKVGSSAVRCSQDWGSQAGSRARGSIAGSRKGQHSGQRWGPSSAPPLRPGQGLLPLPTQPGTPPGTRPPGASGRGRGAQASTPALPMGVAPLRPSFHPSNELVTAASQVTEMWRWNGSAKAMPRGCPAAAAESGRPGTVRTAGAEGGGGLWFRLCWAGGLRATPGLAQTRLPSVLGEPPSDLTGPLLIMGGRRDTPAQERINNLFMTFNKTQTSPHWCLIKESLRPEHAGQAGGGGAGSR